MLDFSKPVTTRDGRKVRILCTDAPGPFPVVGYIIGNDPFGSIRLCTWASNGCVVVTALQECIDDLIQAEGPVVRYASVCGQDSVTWGRCSFGSHRVFKLTFDGDRVTGELVK